MTLQKTDKKSALFIKVYSHYHPPPLQASPPCYIGREEESFLSLSCTACSTVCITLTLNSTRMDRLMSLRPLIRNLSLCYVSGELTWSKPHFWRVDMEQTTFPFTLTLFLTLPHICTVVFNLTQALEKWKRIMHGKKLNWVVSMAFLRVKKKIQTWRWINLPRIPWTVTTHS